jgi:hypothetical protein
MNITYDKSLKQRVWQAVNSKIADKTCPFCKVKITGKNFAGAAWINDEFRAFDGNIICLIALSDALKEVE